MQHFREYIDKKNRRARHELEILKKVLETKKFSVADFMEEDEPYIFVKAPTESDLSFDGIRLYKIGKTIAYRVQKEESTHPYGKAYMLDVEDMFKELLSEKKDEAKAGHEVIETIIKEVQRFFKKSQEAEEQLRSGDMDQGKDPMGRVIMRGSASGSDYSSLLHSKGN